MYALHFQLCLGSFDSEPPHCKILLFLNLSVIKKQSIICQESQVLIPIHILQAFSGAPALTVSGKTLGQRHEALGEAQTKPCREQHWQSHRNLCVCAHTCVHACLRTPDKFVQGSIWFVDTAFSPHYPAVFLALGNR